jgi:hypothetical protein
MKKSNETIHMKIGENAKMTLKILAALRKLSLTQMIIELIREENNRVKWDR